ncbi:unnamed protein product [Urochloa humidicola]
MDAGSGNASGGGGGASACCYYAMLGIRKNASPTDIRTAYRRLAMKWHPDRWASDPGASGEAKRRFQRIQEAYSVLSDKGKKAMYDAGLFDPLDDDDQKPDTLEDLQKMLEDIVKGDEGSRGGVGVGGRAPPDSARRARVAPYPQQQSRR